MQIVDIAWERSSGDADVALPKQIEVDNKEIEGKDIFDYLAGKYGVPVSSFATEPRK
jgi:hypothetical protein